MKSITEFAKHLLVMGISARAALVAEGKTPEEIQASLGATFKYEGDRLKYFINALDVAGQYPKTDDLRRLLVVSLAEGESVPAKAVKVEEIYYLPEFLIAMNPQAVFKQDGKGGRGKGRPGRGGGSREMRESPWGLSPAQKAAKKGGGKAPGKP